MLKIAPDRVSSESLLRTSVRECDSQNTVVNLDNLSQAEQAVLDEVPFHK